MKRTAIIVEKKLSPGQAANISAILMGQVAISFPGIYSEECLRDKTGTQHAAIQYSLVVLKAGQGQIVNLITHLKKKGDSQVDYVTFSRFGQSLQNEYDKYKNQIRTNETDQLQPVAVVVSGYDPEVRMLTKKFSLFQ